MLWIDAGLQNAAMATLLAALALAVTRVVRNPAVGHVLWLIVLAKLVTPPLVQVPIPVAWPRFAGSSLSGPGLSLLVTWGVLSLILGLRILTRGIQFGRLVRTASRHDADAQRRVGELARQINLPRRPRVVLLEARTTPLVWGLGPWSTVVFPAELWRTASAVQRDALLLHELTHIRRGDTWTRLLELLAVLAFWWHPVLWVARRELARFEEESCDRSAAASLAGHRRDYAEALLAAIDFTSGGAVTPALATGVRPTGAIARRLTDIMQSRGPIGLSRRNRFGLAVIAAMCLVFSPSPGTPRAQQRLLAQTAPAAISR